MILDATIFLTGKQSKKTVFSALMTQFCASVPHIDSQTLFEQFWQREILGSTGIGHGVAIPHICCDYVKETHAVLLKLEQPIDYAGVDKHPVDIVIGMLFSESHSRSHNLNELRHIATFFNSSNHRQLIRDAEQSTTIEYLLKEVFQQEEDLLC